VHTRGGVGALSTQALMNPLYGPAGIDLLAAGVAAEEIVARLTDADEGRAQRQLHLIGAHGRGAAFTGKHCIEWCGHRVHEGFSVAGNMLAGTDVLDATAAAYADGARLPLAERLIAAMQAGERAGGDKRGKQAAALRIHADEDYPQLEIRVDDHEEPVRELQRLYEKSLERYQPFTACLAGRNDPVGVTDRAIIEERIARFHRERGGRA
jgi:uncharacterized Ntn-hydrolase superfamily protein